jgi:Inner membrane protein YgaP-like, transmembrane domain
MEVNEMNITQNEHIVDRGIRLVVAVALGAAFLTGTVATPLGYVALILAAVMLVTGLTGFCPLYALVGIRTRSTR